MAKRSKPVDLSKHPTIYLPPTYDSKRFYEGIKALMDMIEIEMAKEGEYDTTGVQP